MVIYLIYFRGHQFSSAIVDVGLEGTEFLALLSQFGCLIQHKINVDHNGCPTTAQYHIDIEYLQPQTIAIDTSDN